MKTSDRPTPETDALGKELWLNPNPLDRTVKTFAHARQLEQQRDEARAERDELRVKLLSMTEHRDELDGLLTALVKQFQPLKPAPFSTPDA